MAKSYYKQSERPVVEGVDWGQISTDLSAKLATEQKRREDLKTQLDTESRDYISEFNDTPQGQHDGSNERMARFADDASMYMLDLDKKLKSGQLPLRDYNAMRANLQQGTTDMFNVSKTFNTNYDASLLRAGSGEASAEEIYQNAQLQAFGDPSSTGIYIDPVSGQMSLAKLVDDGNGKLVPSSKPSDRKSVFSLKNSVERKINNFNMKEFSEGIKGEYDVKYQKVISGGDVKTLDDMKKSEDFEKATNDLIQRELVNTHNAASILTNRADKEYTFETLDTNKLPDVPKEGVIYLVPDPTNPNSGATQPLLTSTQELEASEILRTAINSKIGVTETSKTKGKNVKPASTLLKDYSSWVNSRIDVPLSINETDAKNQLDNAFAGLGFNITETNIGSDELTITSPDGAVLVLDLDLENSLDIVNSFINLNTPVNIKGVLYTSGEIPKSSTAIPTYAEWQKQNPNGTLTEYSNIYFPSK